MVNFEPISINDTKELRKELGLPITKTLRYMKHSNSEYEVIGVKDYIIVDKYQPSGIQSLKVTLDTDEK